MYAGMSVPASGPQDGQTSVAFLDTQPTEEPPAGSDVESKSTWQTTRGDEAPEAFLISETEPSEVQDQVLLPAEAEHDGHRAGDAGSDGDKSTNSGRFQESATCQQVVNQLAAVTESLEVSNAVIPADIQAEELSLSQLNPYGDNHGMEAAVPVLQKALEAQRKVCVDTKCPPKGFKRPSTTIRHPASRG